MSDPVVAIDGPVGVGKSSVAKRVARALQFQHLDTGAMYRAVIWLALQNADADSIRDEDLIQIAQSIDLKFCESGALICNGHTLTTEIRANEISRLVYRAADLPGVRGELVRRQQEIGKQSQCVLEGRDITTIVFPGARWKFYLDASPSIRAQRRWEQLRENGKSTEYRRVHDDLLERDRKDRARAIGGLKVAPDAIVLDTSYLSEQKIVDLIIAFVQAPD